MSLTTLIKDYIEVAANDFLSVNTVTVQEIIPHLGQFLLTNSGRFLYYLISFEWLQENVFLPLQIPSSIYFDFQKSQLQGAEYITFFELPSIKNNLFLLFFCGVFNSFFLSLPLTCSHFISIRRLMIQGIPAGIYSSFGTIFGQFLFFVSLFSGFHFFLTSWITFEPYNYFIGLFLIVSIVYDMVTQRSLSLIGGKRIKTLTKIFFLNFFLSWIEQSCFGTFLSNVTVLKQPSILEMFDLFNPTTTFQLNVGIFSYLFGILFGSLFFTLVFGWGFYFLFHRCASLYATYYSRWVHRLNSSLILLILAITLTSYSDYGANLLFTKPLGFISEDKAVKETIFFPVDVIDPVIFFSESENTSERDNEDSRKKLVDFDPTNFDKGVYLRPSLVNQSWSKPIEYFHFSGEQGWSNRKEYEANTWMERYKKKRSQRIIHSFVKGLRYKEKHDNRTKRSKTSGEDVSQKSSFQQKNIQFIPTANSQSYLNELFFINKLQQKPFIKVEKLEEPNFEKFIQSISSKDYEIKNKEEKNFSLLELNNTEKERLLQDGKRMSLVYKYNEEMEKVSSSNLLPLPIKQSIDVNLELENLFKEYVKEVEDLYLPHRTENEKEFDKEKKHDQTMFSQWFSSFYDKNYKESEEEEWENSEESEDSIDETEFFQDHLKEDVEEFQKANSDLNLTFLPEEEQIKREKAVDLVTDAVHTYSERLEQIDSLSKRTFLEKFAKKERGDRSLYKKLYYSNPIYKILLNFDIDSFLSRQPKNYQLTPIQEKLLFEKRQVLQSYYDGLFRYTTLLDNPENRSNLVKFEDVENSLTNHKPFSIAADSYSNRIYNQQFKGTLRIVRQLFAITPEAKKRSLKYDQPLFDDTKEVEKNSLLHEDLLDEELSFEEELEFETERVPKKSDELTTPYLVKTNPIPFYTGWDSELRKFVITTKFQPRVSTGVEILLPTEKESQMYSTLSTLISPKKKTESIREIYFTHWPLTEKFLNNPKSESIIKYETLFDSKSDPLYDYTPNSDAFGYFSDPEEDEDRKAWEYTRVPTNVTAGTDIFAVKFSDRVPFPRGGGFVWPGNPSFPKKVKDLFTDMNFKNLKQHFKKLLSKN